MLLLKNKSLNEKNYKTLIMYLYKHCEIITFLVPDFNYAVGVNYEDRIKPLLEDIKPFIQNNYVSDEYCDRKTEGIYNIYRVNFDYYITEVLCSVPGLYKWIYPNLPEDLCFYKNGKCFLRSVAHEKLCWIYTEDEKEIKALEKIGLKFTKMPFEQAPSL